METVNSADEQRLLAAVKAAIDLADGGTAPDDALAKVAGDYSLPPGMIGLVAHAFNTGRQTFQREHGCGALDKLAEFPLADPARVVARVYGAKEAADVSADYRRPPTWAQRPAPLTKAAASQPPPQLNPEYALTRAFGDIDRARRACAEAKLAAARLGDDCRRHAAEAVGYFRKLAGARLPFAAVEDAVRTYLGSKAAALLDVIYDQARLKALGEKRAAAAPAAWPFPFDLDAEPFRSIKRCVKAAEAAVAAKAEYDALMAKLAGAEEDALRPFVGMPPRPSRPPGPSCALSLCWSDGEVKAAGLFGTPALGAAVGTMLARGVGNMPKSKDELVEDAWMELEDPRHQNELRQIRAQALLGGLMTDPDDPISGFDPDTVLKAYNEIAQLAPRMAEQPFALAPALRRRLQGKVEPFEAKELTDIEKGLRDAKAPTPSTNLLGSVPGGLLG